MQKIISYQESAKVRNRRVHMANERTFLAWIRTCIGIMAFGFVVEKFAFFMKQMSIILDQSKAGNTLPLYQGNSAIIGIFLVGLGTLLVIFAFIRYKNVERQIDSDTFRTSSILNIILTVSLLAVGILLVAYFIQSI